VERRKIAGERLDEGDVKLWTGLDDATSKPEICERKIPKG
jgi:hypothetical protein